MERIIVEAGQWILTEGGPASRYVYKLEEGHVSVYSHGERINELIIHKGDEPIYLGIIAAFRSDRMNIASILTETESIFEQIPIDQFWGIYRYEMPPEIREKVGGMIESIWLHNEIVSLKRQLEESPYIDLEIPEEIPLLGKISLDEIKRLYDDVAGEF